MTFPSFWDSNDVCSVSIDLYFIGFLPSFILIVDFIFWLLIVDFDFEFWALIADFY